MYVAILVAITARHYRGPPPRLVLPVMSQYPRAPRQSRSPPLNRTMAKFTTVHPMMLAALPNATSLSAYLGQR